MEKFSKEFIEAMGFVDFLDLRFKTLEFRGNVFRISINIKKESAKIYKEGYKEIVESSNEMAIYKTLINHESIFVKKLEEKGSFAILKADLIG